MAKPTRLLTVLALALLSPLATVRGAPAQQFGDYILTDFGAQTRGLVHVDRATGTLTKWPQPPVGEQMHGVRMDRKANARMLAVVDAGPSKSGYLALVSQTNTFKVTTLSLGVHAIDIADGQDGSVIALVPGGQLYRDYRYNQYNNIIISWLPRNLTAVTIDVDTGDYVVSSGNGELLRVNPVSRAIATIASGLGAVADVDFDPRTGGFVIATKTAPGVRLVNRAGATTATYPLANASAVRVDIEFGTIHAAGGDTIVEFARTGAVLKSLRFAGYRFTSLERFGHAKLSADGVPRPRNNYFVYMNFGAAAANKPYYFALNISGMRPGIPVSAGRVIQLKPDALFRFTLRGDIPTHTRGMQGTTRSNGSATVQLILAGWVPYGLRVWASGVVVDPTKPGGLHVGNTIGFTIRPSSAP